MNLIHNIAATHRAEVSNALQSQANSQTPQDLMGFLTQMLQQLQTSQPASSAALPSTNIKDLTAKIADALKKSSAADPASVSSSAAQSNGPQDLAGKIASILKQDNPALNISQQDLTAKIKSLLQKNNLQPDDTTIKPTLITDLVANLASQIQNATGASQDTTAKKITDILNEKTGSPQVDLTNLLNQLQPDNTQNADIAKMLVDLQAQTQPLDPAILQQMKDQVTQLIQSKGDTLSADDIKKLKDDMTQSLKDQGMDQPTIDHYMVALAHMLKQDIAPAAPAAQASATSKTAVTDALTNPSSNALTPQQDLPDVAKGLKQAQTNSNAVKDASLLQHLQAQANTANTPAPQQQAPQQTVTGKAAGFSVNPALINELANSDSNSSSNGFGTNDNGQPSALPAGVDVMKPLTADNLNNQNFTNYLADAKNMPSATAQMVSLQLQRNIAARIDTMTIQLEPADLGCMDIKLKFDKDGGVKAHMTVDKPETLAMLQKDQHHLGRALQQSGFDLDENSLSFDLRQQNRQQNLMSGYNGNGQRASDEFSGQMNGTTTDKNTVQAMVAVPANGYITQNSVNIMV